MGPRLLQKPWNGGLGVLQGLLKAHHGANQFPPCFIWIILPNRYVLMQYILTRMC